MSDIWQKLDERRDDPDADLIYGECDSELMSVIRDACDEIADLRTENERLRVAIQPFAETASGIPDNWPGACVLAIITDGVTCHLSYYHSCCSDGHLPTIADWRRLKPETQQLTTDQSLPHMGTVGDGGRITWDPPLKG